MRSRSDFDRASCVRLGEGSKNVDDLDKALRFYIQGGVLHPFVGGFEVTCMTLATRYFDSIFSTQRDRHSAAGNGGPKYSVTFTTLPLRKSKRSTTVHSSPLGYLTRPSTV